jgi:hypothetical protein
MLDSEISITVHEFSRPFTAEPASRGRCALRVEVCERLDVEPPRTVGRRSRRQRTVTFQEESDHSALRATKDRRLVQPIQQLYQRFIRSGRCVAGELGATHIERQLNDSEWDNPLLPIAAMYRMAAVNRLDLRRRQPIARTPKGEPGTPVRFI